VPATTASKAPSPPPPARRRAKRDRYNASPNPGIRSGTMHARDPEVAPTAQTDWRSRGRKLEPREARPWPS
jgi:hypothetical protein